MVNHQTLGERYSCVFCQGTLFIYIFTFLLFRDETSSMLPVGNPYHSAYKSTNEDILKWSFRPISFRTTPFSISDILPYQLLIVADVGSLHPNRLSLVLV